MNKFLFVVLLSVSGLLWAEVPELIKTQFDERIELNKQYKEDYTEPVRDHPQSERLVPLAQGNGDDWVALLTHLRDHGSLRVQFLMLRVEHFAEIIPYMMEREQAETEEERERVSGLLKKFESRLKALETFYEESVSGRSSEPSDSKAEPSTDSSLPLTLLNEQRARYLGYGLQGFDWVNEYEQSDLLLKRVKQDNRDWVELTEVVADSGDPKLMYLFLRTVLQGELYFRLVDLPELHPEDRIYVEAEIRYYQNQLDQLTDWWKEHRADQASPQDDTELRKAE